MKMRDLSTPISSTTSGSRRLHPTGWLRHKWSFIAAFLLAVIYLLTSVLIASHRQFWYDEILTVTFSQLPNLAAIWKALTHGGDSMPPTYYMLVRIFEHLPISREIAARLPSALAMVMGMLITFDCARRLSDGVHGLIAFSVLSCSTLCYYGYEARPYAIYFMFASLALWLWIHGSDTSKLSAFLFGVVIFLAVTVHYYAVLCLVPYAAWEVSKWREWRAPSSKLIAGFLGVLCAGVLFLRQILSLRQFSPDFWSQPKLETLAAVYDDFFPYALFPLAAIMILVALSGLKERDTLASRMQPSEQLGWFFALIPLVGFALAKLGTNAFHNRYLISLLPGIAVAFSCLLWRQLRSAPWISIVALLLFAVLGLGIQFNLLVHPARVRPIVAVAKSEPRRMNAMFLFEDKIQPGAKQFIVFPASDVLGLEARYYSRHPERYVYLFGPDSIGTTPRTLTLLRQYSPMRFWTLDDLRAHARESVLVNPSQETIAALEQIGHKTTCRILEDLEIVSAE